MDKKKPLVSVLLCTYNDEKYLDESMQSILNQSYENFEFVIVNDGSTDNTKNIIQAYRDVRIRYLEHTENKGLEDAKNWGLTEIRGKYIAYIDGDDIAMLDRLKIQTEFMEANPEVGLCGTVAQIFGNRSILRTAPENDFDIRCRTLFGTPIPHPSCMIRTAVLRKHNITYRKDFPAAEDYPFMVEILKQSKSHCIQIPLLKYRWHGQNISVLKKEVQDAGTKKAMDFAYKILLNIDATEEEQHAYAESYFSRFNYDSGKLFESLRDKLTADESLEKNVAKFREHLKAELNQKIAEHKKVTATLAWKIKNGLSRPIIALLDLLSKNRQFARFRQRVFELLQSWKIS
ncbi:MAG: glycosyltransferase involved in cell wall biosynthesis [Saprospiraceae bacterium]|jgi:glycosyltransferase involved in cell wall biosynthesis